MTVTYIVNALAICSLLALVFYLFYWMPKRVRKSFRNASGSNPYFQREYYYGSLFFTVFGISLEDGKVIFANSFGQYVLDHTEIAEWYFTAVPSSDKDGRFTIKYTMKIVSKSPELQGLKLDGLSESKFDDLEQIKIQFNSVYEVGFNKRVPVENHAFPAEDRVQRAIDKLCEAKFSPDDRFRGNSERVSRFNLGVQILVDECESQFGKYDGIDALGEFFLRRETDSGDIGYSLDSLRTMISKETSAYLRSKNQHSSS